MVARGREAQPDQVGRDKGPRPIVNQDKLARIQREEAGVDGIGPLGAALDQGIDDTPGLASAQIRQAAQAVRRADHRKLIDLRNSGQGRQRVPQKR
jgi:hypothetical protein